MKSNIANIFNTISLISNYFDSESLNPHEHQRIQNIQNFNIPSVDFPSTVYIQVQNLAKFNFSQHKSVRELASGEKFPWAQSSFVHRGLKLKINFISFFFPRALTFLWKTLNHRTSEDICRDNHLVLWRYQCNEINSDENITTEKLNQQQKNKIRK